MRKRFELMTLMTVLVIVSATLLVAQDARVRTPRRSRPTRGTPSASQPASTGSADWTGILPQPTRIQARIFDLHCGRDQLARLAVDKLTAGEPDTQEMLRRLGQFGEARLVLGVDDTINILIESTWTQTEPRPDDLSQQLIPSRGGNLGLGLTISGHWADGGRSDWAELRCQIDASTLAKSHVSIGHGAMLHTFNSFWSNKTVTVRSNEPTCLMASDVQTQGEEKDSTNVVLVQLTASKASTPGPGKRMGPPASQPTAPPRPDLNDQPMQPTRLQVRMFEVRCDWGQLIRLDLNQLTAGRPGPQELLERLGAFGTARLLVELDDAVNLPADSELTCGHKMPIVGNPATTRNGEVTPSVDYQNLGVETRFTGHWRDEGRSDWAELRCQIKASTITKSGVTIGHGVMLPMQKAFGSNKSVAVRSGEPTYILTNDLPVPDDEKDSACVTLVELTATKLKAPDFKARPPVPAATAVPASNPAAGARPNLTDKPLQPTRLQTRIFELRCNQQQLLRVDTDKIMAGNPNPEEFLRRLGEFGSARLVVHLEDTVGLPSDSTLKQGQSAPIVKEVSTSGHGTAVTYKDIGVDISLSGQWGEGDRADSADLKCRIQCSSIARTGTATAPDDRQSIVNNINIKRQITAHSAKPVYLVSSDQATPDDKTGEVSVTFTQLTATRLAGPQAAAAAGSAGRP